MSVSSSGRQANSDSGLTGLAISAEGRFVAFVAKATNLVKGDINNALDVFVRTR